MALDLEALKAIHTKMQDPANWDLTGICDEYAEMSEDYSLELKTYFPRWPDYSGDSMFPVPTEATDTPPGAAFLGSLAPQMWDRSQPYAAKRWELLEWLIAEVEAGR